MKIFSLLLLVVLLVGRGQAADSCVDRCGENDGTVGCQCNTDCTDFDDCCSDYTTVCYSCSGRCDDSYIYSEPCACNSDCASHSDCCDDYSSVCEGVSTSGPGTTSGSGTTSSGSGTTSNTGSGSGSVTDDQILTISETLASLDYDNVFANLTIDIQGLTTSSASDDVAPDNLYTSVPPLTAQTYVTFEALRDNYNRDESQPEVVTSDELTEQSNFLDAVMATSLMTSLEQFMTDNDLIVGSLRDNLEEIWFTLYERDGALSSSGFEHAFIGEIKGSSVGGFHNWVSFYLEEAAGNANYEGYEEYTDLGATGYVLTDRFTWYSANKPTGGGLVGTSPEYDMGIFTLCFFSRPNQQCTVQANSIQFGVQTYQQSYNGKTLVGSSYPLVLS